METIESVYDKIRKRENRAIETYNKEFGRKYPSKEHVGQARGSMLAYEDCKMLIKESGLLDIPGKIEFARNLVKELKDKGFSMTEIIEGLGI